MHVCMRGSYVLMGCSLLVGDLSEERKIDAAVLAVLDEVGVVGEVVVLAVFQDEETVLAEYVACHDNVG